MIIPLIIEQTLALSVGMFDTIMVAYAGESAVSGVSLVDSISYLVINLFSALATGGAIVAGQYLGSGERKNGSHAAKQLALAVFSLSLLLLAICLLGNGAILSTLFGQVEASVMSNARTYFYLMAVSYPFVALFNVAASLFRGMGNTKTAMLSALIMNLMNICGNAVFIYCMKWGAFGAGLATLIARMTASVIMMILLRSPELPISVYSYSLRDLDFGMIKRILKIGIPSGIEGSVFQFGRIITTGLVAAFGTTSIAAHAVGSSLAGLEIIPGAAMGLAITTVVSRCIGAGDYEQAKRYTHLLMKQAYLFLWALNIVILLLLKPILGLYGLSPETYRIAFRLMLIHGIGAMILWPLSFTLPNAFRAAGDVRFTMVFSIASMFLFRVGGGYLLAHMTELGVLSVWFGMLMDWLFRSSCFLWRWLSGKWKRFAVI